MLYLLSGVEQFLIDQKVASIKKEFPVFEPELNDTKLDCREHTCQELINEVTSVPFFSDYRLVTLTHPYFLTSEKVKGDKPEEIERLVDVLCHLSDDMIVIIYAPGKLDERKKTTKALRKVATSIEFDHPEPHRLKAICRQAFKARKTTIDEDALDLLLARAGESLMHLQNETDKLSLYASHLTLEDVSRMVSKPIEENAFELTNAILKRDVGKAFEIYRDLMTKNEEPVRLIALMASSLRTLYQVKLLDRKGYTDQEIGKYLDMNPYRLRYIRHDSPNFELDDLMQLIQSLSDLDLQIKRGMIDKYQGLELFLVKLNRGK